MKKDTVLLAVEKYNELRDFKKKVEESLKESKFAVIEERWGSSFGFCGGYTRKYYTENESIIDFETRNKELEAKIEKFGLKKPLNDIKKMSYFEFRKWCKS